MTVDLRDLLDDADRELAPLEREYFLAEWKVAQDATDDGEQALVDASLAYDTALADEGRYRALLDAERHNGHQDGGHDRRRLIVLRNGAEARQRPRDLAEAILRREASLASLYSLHRGEFGGRAVSNNELDELLRTSTDAAERRAAWETSKSIGPAAAGQVRELARLRNEAARKLGYRDHFAMSLALDELDEAWLFALLDRLEELLSPAWARVKAAIDADQRRRLGLPDSRVLRPWDYADPFFQEPPPAPDDRLDALLAGLDPLAVCRPYFEALGEPVDEILARSDLYPRENKNQHAFCIPIERISDVRVLANVVPGERWLETMLHELGHAVYERAIDPGLPWTLRTPSHIFTTEAIAMLHGRRARDPRFLRDFAGLGEAADDPRHAEAVQRQLHIFVPWVQVVTRFEQALYADPDADLGRTWWELVERYQRVAPPDGERPDDWASKQHVALSPVYYQNYLLGQVTASQLEWALQRETGSHSPAADPERAGRLLRERFMRPGASLRWDALVEHATGAPLSVEHFARELS
jgi:peptidyl-dipeptidase A